MRLFKHIKVGGPLNGLMTVSFPDTRWSLGDGELRMHRERLREFRELMDPNLRFVIDLQNIEDVGNYGFLFLKVLKKYLDAMKCQFSIHNPPGERIRVRREKTYRWDKEFVVVRSRMGHREEIYN